MPVRYIRLPRLLAWRRVDRGRGLRLQGRSQRILANGVILGKDGALYGTSSNGAPTPCIGSNGHMGCGEVFRLAPPASPGGAWTETRLYRFAGDQDGAFPTGKSPWP